MNYKLKWGLGIGDWGLGIGDWAQSPIPNPQSPIPNPHSIFIFILFCLNLIDKFEFKNIKNGRKDFRSS